jgi:hypothetical protein
LDEAARARQDGDERGAVALERAAEEVRQRSMVTGRDATAVVYLPREIAWYYLSLCASNIARDCRSDLSADGDRFADAAIRNEQGIGADVATAILEAYLPSDPSTLDPRRIREFRETFGTKRLKFQVAVQELVKKCSEVSSETEMDRIARSATELAKEQVEAAKQTYRRAQIDMVVKTIGVSLTPPAVLTYLASALGIGLFPPAGIAAALGLFV